MTHTRLPAHPRLMSALIACIGATACSTGPAMSPDPSAVFDAERLRASVGDKVTLRLTGRMDEAAEAVNVAGRLVRNEEADWSVISTPSSGWFTCAGERGPGIAALLALAEWAHFDPTA
ncbi:MAG: hypothetical protein IH939_16655 [Acidobacteria bacterium]|nr:hypothetical protein [Acidobacteriota bacterium]